jgi:predicted alpha/beta hydrolase family esterase
MGTTLVVPGLDGGGADHWLSWFESVLPDTRRVTQEDPQALDLSEWSAAVRAELMQSPTAVTIVAHGFGCLACVVGAADCPEKVEGAMLVAPFDPDALQLSWLMPEEPLAFPAVIVASRNDPYMRLNKAAFWANYWSCDFIDFGRAGSIDPAAGFGTWPAGLEILDGLRHGPRADAAVYLRSRRVNHLSRAI